MTLKSPDQRRDAILADVPHWPDLTIAGRFDLTADRYPGRPMILTADDAISYCEAQQRSRALAAGLIALGLQPGEHVALVMANYPEFPLIKLAIARAGAIAVPVNFQLRGDELHYVLEQSQACMVFGMDSFRDHDHGTEAIAMQTRLPALRYVILRQSGTGALMVDRQAIELEALATPDADAERAHREAGATGEAVSDIIYTSGTTGRPKGAMITHDMVLRAALSSALTRSFEDGRRIQFALPMYHVFGYVECWVAALFVGGAIIPHAVFDADEMLDTAIARSVTDMICVPMMMHRLIDAARARDLPLPALLAVFNSGGNNVPSVWDEIRTALGAREIHTAYGMTETTASAMCTWTEDGPEKLLDTNGRWKLAGPAGDPVLGGRVAEYRVVDPETGRELALDEDGELQVRGPIVTKGYFAKPEETAQAFTADGWFRTGDVGRLLPGGYLKLTGRIKETYRCGGEMVMPKEIEDLLAGQPGVAQVLAVGVPDARMGETGCLCVVAEDGALPDLDAMLALCAQRLARFKVPRHALLLDAQEIPLTATGRPQKFKLARIAADQLALS